MSTHCLLSPSATTGSSRSMARGDTTSHSQGNKSPFLLMWSHVVIHVGELGSKVQEVHLGA